MGTGYRRRERREQYFSEYNIAAANSVVVSNAIRLLQAAEAAAGHPLPSLRQKKFPVRLRKKMSKRKKRTTNPNKKRKEKPTAAETELP